MLLYGLKVISRFPVFYKRVAEKYGAKILSLIKISNGTILA